MVKRVVVMLAGLASCGGDPGPFARPLPDPLLAAPIDPEEIDFEASKPVPFERHHAPLLTSFEGVHAESCPDELVKEALSWAWALPRETRRDQANWLSSRFPKGWSPTRTWVPGSVTGDVRLQYFELDGFTYCVGRVGRMLAWSSTAAPNETHPLEHEGALGEYQSWLAFDAAVADGEIVLVHDGATGLHEIVLRPARGELLVERRRSLSRTRSEDPRLLAVGADLLLLSRGYTGKGAALFAMRRPSGSSEWSAPVPLTADLGGTYSCAVRGDQVLVAWLDDRFARLRGMGLIRTDKPFAITSLDRGVTWGSPVCLQDPMEERASSTVCLHVFVCGERWLILTQDSDGWRDAPDGADAIALASDLGRWAFLPGKQRPILEQHFRERIARGR